MRELGRHAKNAVDRLAFNAWLRSGSVPDDLIDLARELDEEDADDIERKFNPNHDERGRFTFGSGGTSESRGYRGMTKQGIGTIKPINGGKVDPKGRYIPEQFSPDPYALHSPTEALAHYVSRSGEDRNYYIGNVDLSHISPTKFDKIATLVKEGEPGVYPIIDALGYHDGNRYGEAKNATSAWTVGGLKLHADGVLVIEKGGRYHFSGSVTADAELYDFNKRNERTKENDILTTIGRQVPGVGYTIHVIGSKPFSGVGRR